jgi:hypothetical protein
LFRCAQWAVGAAETENPFRNLRPTLLWVRTRTTRRIFTYSRAVRGQLPSFSENQLSL